MSNAIPSPSYTNAGRQLPFHESPSQRVARVDFIKKREGDKRVEAWVRLQQEHKQSLWGAATTNTCGEPYIATPHLSEDPIRSGSPFLSVPYIHPEDEEPFIFYSSAPLHPAYIPEIIYSTPLPLPVKPKPRRVKHGRHRRRLSDLDSIPEEVTVEG
ncbi:uncharacterized protein BT62DRAFT_78069 [Guyanagaster necrorhizus]|uniref:Uncharacterized protein n=1 Tax=Guyanagaster necrorhizus TaxID=856835 RepID=A0A9P7VVB7_9AGAR|nr:uncharacterized protein BT62DRAFT_78069 [Guyanagaster necrorhizus MCA 3950]KAG7447370.1 hypothetical protein BT62DRAFT_78069 [Guyanagaster necrorhizus MCA 3950]